MAQDRLSKMAWYWFSPPKAKQVRRPCAGSGDDGAEIPATRPLQQIAAERRHVADLRACRTPAARPARRSVARPSGARRPCASVTIAPMRSVPPVCSTIAIEARRCRAD